VKGFLWRTAVGRTLRPNDKTAPRLVYIGHLPQFSISRLATDSTSCGDCANCPKQSVNNTNKKRTVIVYMYTVIRRNHLRCLRIITFVEGIVVYSLGYPWLKKVYNNIRITVINIVMRDKERGKKCFVSEGCRTNMSQQMVIYLVCIYQPFIYSSMICQETTTRILKQVCVGWLSVIIVCLLNFLTSKGNQKRWHS